MVYCLLLPIRETEREKRNNFHHPDVASVGLCSNHLVIVSEECSLEKNVMVCHRS